MIRVKSQEMQMKEKLYKEGYFDDQIERLTPPGLELLHKKSHVEIADALTNILKARRGIKKFTWNIEEGYIEITCSGKTF